MRRPLLIALAAAVSAGIAYGAWANLSSRAADQAPAKSAPQVSPGVAVTTAVAQAGDFPLVHRAVGWVEAVATVTLRPRVEGMIVETAVKDGQTVKAGDLLFRLDDAVMQASVAKDEAAITKDAALLDQAQSDAVRQKTLLSQNIAARKTAELAEAAAKEAAGSLAADRAQLQADKAMLSYYTITAPMDGRIGVVAVTTGNFVKSGDSLATLTRMAPLRVSFSLPERDLDALRQALDRPTPTQVTIRARGESRTRAVGTLNFLDSSVDRKSGTILAKAEVPNARQELWPGQYVDVEIALGQVEGAALIPLRAVQQNAAGAYVFVVGDDERAARRPVTVAATGNGTAAVTGGVEPGERVVTEGQIKLSDGVRVREAAPPGAVQARAEGSK